MKTLMQPLPAKIYQWKFNTLHPDHPDFDKRTICLPLESQKEAAQRQRDELKGMFIGRPWVDSNSISSDTVTNKMQRELLTMYFIGIYEEVDFPEILKIHFPKGLDLEDGDERYLNYRGYYLEVPFIPKLYTDKFARFAAMKSKPAPAPIKTKKTKPAPRKPKIKKKARTA